MARWISQGGYGWGSTLPSGTAQPDLPPVEAWGESNLDQRPAKSRSPNGESSSTLPGPRRSAQLIRATRCQKIVLHKAACFDTACLVVIALCCRSVAMTEQTGGNANV